MNGIRPVRLAALSIQRGAEYPSLVELKGGVEIRTQVCIMRGNTASKKGTVVCDGETILRADEAIFHEDTGTVRPKGGDRHHRSLSPQELTGVPWRASLKSWP